MNSFYLQSITISKSAIHLGVFLNFKANENRMQKGQVNIEVDSDSLMKVLPREPQFEMHAIKIGHRALSYLTCNSKNIKNPTQEKINPFQLKDRLICTDRI